MEQKVIIYPEFNRFLTILMWSIQYVILLHTDYAIYFQRLYWQNNYRPTLPTIDYTLR